MIPGVARFWASKRDTFDFSKQLLVSEVVNAVVNIDAFVVVRTTPATRSHVRTMDLHSVSKFKMVEVIIKWLISRA